jgi:2,4-dienoyl-CoA reductase-like NADH-dependent reductase (Old Yellow Enzyme family)
MTSDLFSTFSLAGITFPNRIAVSPMAQYSAIDGVAQPWHLQHLGSLAVSGPALVMLESTAVEPPGYGSQVCLALHTDAQEQGLRELLKAVRSFSDTRFGIQFGHSGRKASAHSPRTGQGPLTVEKGGWTTYGPSPICFGSGWPEPAELDEAGLKRVKAAYVQATARAARLDLDLIELHGAHGYLLHSFLSPLSNRRTDAYGGSLANRIRFVAEIIESMKKVWPAGRILGIRLNSSDWEDGGLTIEDTIAISANLRESGCDYICVSAGAITDKTRIPASPGYLAPFAGRIRREARIATMVTGLIADPKLADRVIADGDADMVAIARAFLDDPRWVWHAAQALGSKMSFPMQYERASPKNWPVANTLRPS